MEHFEKQTISPAAKKQTRCHRYVDNTFVVWPHGKYELQSFLKHLNSVHQNIAFTMEVEQQGTLPLLDVLVKRRLDDSLGHSVYKKPIHTDLNLHAKSEHHPSKKRAVLSTLVRRAKTLCDPGSLREEIIHLKDNFQPTGTVRTTSGGLYTRSRRQN